MRFVRILVFAFVILLLVSFAGCSSNDNAIDNRLDIVCTIFPQYDFVRTIAGNADNVNITMLIGAGQESHDYDPSSKDISKIHDCDIFVYTGGESDSWVTDMLESVDTEKKTIISLFDVVDNLAEHEKVEGMESDKHSHEDDHGAIGHVEYDEHVWTSPKNASVIAESICEAMCDHMPDSADVFRNNYNKFKKDINSVDDSFRAIVNKTDNPIIVVADRFPLLYFCKEYGIKYYAAFSGCAAATEPSSKTVQFLIEKVEADSIPVVFKMDMSAGNVANTVSEATGASVMTFYSCHTVSVDDFNAGITYLDLMNRNIDSLEKALK